MGGPGPRGQIAQSLVGLPRGTDTEAAEQVIVRRGGPRRPPSTCRGRRDGEGLAALRSRWAVDGLRVILSSIKKSPPRWNGSADYAKNTALKAQQSCGPRLNAAARGGEPASTGLGGLWRTALKEVLGRIRSGRLFAKGSRDVSFFSPPFRPFLYGARRRRYGSSDQQVYKACSASFWDLHEGGSAARSRPCASISSSWPRTLKRARRTIHQHRRAVSFRTTGHGFERARSAQGGSAPLMPGGKRCHGVMGQGRAPRPAGQLRPRRSSTRADRRRDRDETGSSAALQTFEQSGFRVCVALALMTARRRCSVQADRAGLIAARRDCVAG